MRKDKEEGRGGKSERRQNKGGGEMKNEKETEIEREKKMD